MDIYGIEVMWHRCFNLLILWTVVLADHFDSKIKMMKGQNYLLGEKLKCPHKEKLKFLGSKHLLI